MKIPPEPTSSIRGVFLDLGGVLVDNAGIGELLDWLPGELSMTELSRRWLLSPTARAFESGKISPAEFIPALIAELGLEVDAATIEGAFAGWIRGPYPGALELVESLRGRVTLACVSNTNPIHWRRMVDEFGLDRRFDHCVVSHEVGHLKPESEIFEIALRRTGLSPAEVLFLDDHEINVAGARNVGLKARIARSLDEVRAALEAFHLLPGKDRES